MEEEIKVLYVDDEPGLLEIARLFLEQAGNFQVSTSTSAKDALDSPQIRSHDLIISDYQMPGMDGIAFLKEVRHRYGDIPFILFTGRGREEIVIEAINNGADFYLQKGGDPTAQFTELAHKIRQAVLWKRAELSRRMAERDLRESEEKYRSLVDIVPLAVLVHREGKIVYANPECIRLSGAGSAEDLMGRELLPLIHPDDRAITLEHFRLISTGAAVPLTEMRIFTLDGRPITVEAAGKPVIYEGLPSVIVVYRDITDRRRGEEELRAAYEQITASEEELRGQYEELAIAQTKLLESQQQLAGIAGTIPGVVYQSFTRPDGSMGASFVSSRSLEIFGIGNDTDGFVDRFTAQVDSRDRDAFLRSIGDAVSSGSPWDFEGRFIKPTGEGIWFQGTSRPVETGSGLVYNGVLLDITGRKKAEEANLAISAELQMIFRNMINAFVVFESVFDETGKYVSFRFGQFNDAYARITNLNYEEVRGKDVFEVWPATELSWLEVYSRVATTGIPETFDMYHAPTRGWYHCNAYRPTASPDKICVIFADITERRQTEKILRESEERSRKILEQVPLPLAIVRNDGVLSFVNDRFVRVFGYTPEEIPTLETWWQLAYPDPDYRQRVRLQWEEAVRNSGAEHADIMPAEYKVTCKSGEERIIEISGITLSDGFLATFTDKTERKRMDEALFSSRQMLQAVLDSIPQRVFWKDRNSVFLGCNLPLALDAGFSDPAEIVGKTDYDHASHATAELYRADDRRVMETGQHRINYEEPQIRPDGSRAWLRTSKVPLRNREGTIIGVMGTYEDITGQKQSEEKLRESEERYRSLVESSFDGIAIHQDGILVFVNRTAARLLGYEDPSSLIGKTALGIIHPDDRALIADRMMESPKRPLELVHEKFLRDDGSYIHVDVATTPCTWEGRPAAYVTFRDISEQKEAERALFQKTEELDQYFTTSLDLFCIAGTDGYFRRLNPEWEKTLGYTLAELEGHRFLDFVHPDDLPSTLAAVADLSGQKQVLNFTNRYRHKDGSYRWIEWRSFPSGDRILAAARDITERKRMEEALRESGELLRLFIQHAPAALAMLDKEMCYIAASRRWMADYHLGDRDIIGQSHYEIFPELTEEIKDVHRRGLAGEITSANEDRFERQDGSVQWLAWEVRPWYTAGNAIGGLIIFSEDITQRKCAEDALRESEEKYRLLVEKANEGITIIQDGLRVYVNPRLADLVGIPAKDLTGTSFLDTVWPEDREMIRIRYAQRCAGENVPETYDFRMTGADGKPRWVYISIAKIQWQGRPATLNLVTDITERKFAEAALQESERNFRNLVENSQSIIFTLHPDGTFTFVSPSWKKHLGHEPAEVLGRNFRMFIHPDDIAMCEAFLEKTIAAGTMQVTNNDYRIFHKDGSIHWHRSSIMPISDEKGNLVSIVGNAVDFTDRKCAEDALQESRAELSSILNGSPVLQFVIGRDHRVLSWNKALEKYSGIPATDVVGTDRQWRPFYPHQRPVLADLLVDDNTDGLFKWYAGKLQPSRYVGGAYEATDFFPAMGTSGTWLSFTAAPIRNADGAIIGAVETLEDLTERRDAEYALRESEEKYRRILENMQDAYIRTDENGIIAMVNPSAACMYGYGSAEEMIGISAASLYAHPGQRDAMYQKLQKSGGVTDFTGVALRKDGRTFPVSLNVQFIHDEEGRAQGMEGIVRDITERKSMEHAIREANRKLKLLNSLTRHDIANQLTMIQGFIQLAATKQSDPVIAEYLSKIDAGSQTIHCQIEFMKTYQELGVHTPGWFRLEETIAKAAGKEVVCSGTCTDIEIFSDPMLEKVFFNLFENAMRHGEHVTEIRVRCERAPDGLVIIVEDNGIGILPDEKEKIFRKGFGKNTGLGLFLAKEILAITGITIRETGEPGTGARFEMTVPRGAWRNSRKRE